MIRQLIKWLRNEDQMITHSEKNHRMAKLMNTKVHQYGDSIEEQLLITRSQGSQYGSKILKLVKSVK